jgi:DNA-binding beta-propeller fold protein YncE
MVRNLLPALARSANRLGPTKNRLARRQRCRPLLLELEDRLTPSLLIPTNDYSAVVYDPSRDRLYITLRTTGSNIPDSPPGGEILRFDVARQQMLAPWTIGYSLMGAAITPDDSSLYVGEEQTSGNQGMVYQVNLNTGAVTDVPFTLAANEGGVFDLAMTPTGKAFVTTESNPFQAFGPVPLRELDTSTNTYLHHPHGRSQQLG